MRGLKSIAKVLSISSVILLTVSGCSNTIVVSDFCEGAYRVPISTEENYDKFRSLDPEFMSDVEENMDYFCRNCDPECAKQLDKFDKKE